MKNLCTLLVACYLAAAAPTADACTSFLVGKKASADGSTMITYCADSHTLYGDIEHTPAADHKPGDLRKVYDWDSGKYLTSIPQPAHTYGVNGNMNELGVAITESTWGGRHETEGSGLIDYGSLIFIALERARTAREAVDIMTSLVKEYGYASEGESFSIADPNEVWIMDLVGKGKADKGAVWVARRLPDDCIAGHANAPRIHKFPLNDKKNTLYSPDVISFAREAGYFNGKDEDFDFAEAYGDMDASAARTCDARVWSFMRRHVADKEAWDKWLPWAMHKEGEPFPLWIKPDKPLTVEDLIADMRDHFEGTPMDMTKDVGSGPFNSPYRFRPLTYKVNDKTYLNERATATQQTGFSLVAQMNNAFPEAAKGVLWFGVDDTNTSVFVPIYCSATEVPYEFRRGNGDLLTLSWDAAFWVNNYVANQAYNRYSQMIPDIRRVQSAQEELIAQENADALKAVAGMPKAQATEYLMGVSDKAAKRYVKAYKDLGDYLFVKYLDGNVKREKDGQFERNEAGLPVSPSQPGYNQEFYEHIVDKTGDHLLVK